MSFRNVVGIVGFKNSGKTGLVERLVAEFTARDFTVATVKHAHHEFTIDQPGTDSFRHKAAGAHQVFVSSSSRWALISEQAPVKLSLEQILEKLEAADITIVEGYKREAFPKIEVWRAEVEAPLLARDDPHIIAVASDGEIEDVAVPILDLNNTQIIVEFILSSLEDGS